MESIILNERQALICDRALEMVQNGIWKEFQQDMKEFSGNEVSDVELNELTNSLRGVY